MINTPFEILKSLEIKHVISKNRKLIVLLFFAFYFVVGISIFKDYGMCWDEEMQRNDNGYVVYNYIFDGDKDALLNGNEKYHGPAFELFLVAIEKVFHIADTRDVYLMRHLVTFLIFYISAIFFYFLTLHIFKNWKMALIGSVFYVLSPQIFSHTFYNSKDPVLLAFFVITTYLLLLFHEKQTYRLAVWYALACAITIDIRIMGIILPLLTLGLVILEVIISLLLKVRSKINIRSVLLFYILLIPLTILFWPVLWEGPVQHFKAAFNEMSKFHWLGKVLYFGEYINANQLPWHYLPVWIGITTPLIYLVFFLIGILYLIKELIFNPIQFLHKRQPDVIILLICVVPLIAVIVLHSIVYDAWRHVFFTYGAFLIIVLHGLQQLYNKIKSYKTIRTVFFLLFSVTLGAIIFEMILLHPYEHLYFNRLAGKDMKEIKSKFELDYYGLAGKEVLEKLLEGDPSSNIRIFAENTPGELNSKILKLEDRKRLIFVSHQEDADYFMGGYRWHKEEYLHSGEEYYATKENTKICTAFKIYSEEEKYYHAKGRLLRNSYCDFERTEKEWSRNAIQFPLSGAHSGKAVTYVDSIREFSDGMYITNVDELFNKENMIVKTSFWKYETAPDATGKFVISIKSVDGNQYFWKCIYDLEESKKDEMGKWINVKRIAFLPKLVSPKDVIAIYLWGENKKTIFIDDVNIEFLEGNF